MAGQRAWRQRGWVAPAAAALSALCALALLIAYRPGPQDSGSTVALDSQLNAARRWLDVPADVNIPLTMPGWGFDPFKFPKLKEGEVPINANWISQFGEDKWLMDHMFYNRRNGTYLEFGAMDGDQWSNTKWLHDNAGWKGLLIEADPGQYSALAQNRKQDITVGAAICNEFRTVHYATNGIWELMAPGFKEIFHQQVDASQLPAVACVPLMFLLDSFNITHIHFWSLDVEGAELAVLEAFEFDRVAVDVIVVETDGHNRTKDAAVGSLLARNGFIAVEHGPDQTPGTLNTMDTFFVHKRYMPHRSSAPGVTELKT
ncbi:methyltransferase fkbm family isoform A [Chlorella sorokiniana]|uniref:Methyltransferase fkbm family isoform A n=1 Tax=Chlorella sorokiniana TaxID=3076 RepID=A0A2P6U589_CHLSO|nr:methyltransferase fkbm family isoform A [Chlorella sorokiniana]|eukprot:PRW61481.1 methyltransferase fkbm family isoform A [Chlorella sorokiniana]